MGEDDRRALIALSLIPGLGSGRIRNLVRIAGSPRAVLEMSPSRLLGVRGIGEQTARSVAEFETHDAVDAQIRAAERIGARMVAEEDRDYPRLLKEIYDPPAFIWVRGSIIPQDDVAIAIIGTRQATSYGRHVAGELAERLSALGFTIVSGLAYGIDTAAHRGALAAEGRSIGVLGSGIDRIYPGSNRDLGIRMIESGALVSEYALGTQPDAPNFPRRNRIISGMCLGVVIVEAFEKGGALITARLAIEQNREVFAVPSRISRHGGPGSGCNRLIQRGHAKLVMSEDDILAEFPNLVQEMIGKSTDPGQHSTAQEPKLDREERLLWNALEYHPIHLDAICAKSELEPSIALVHLLNLEFKGLVRQMAGKQFART